jgi:hypothetical protein
VEQREWISLPQSKGPQSHFTSPQRGEVASEASG